MNYVWKVFFKTETKISYYYIVAPDPDEACRSRYQVVRLKRLEPVPMWDHWDGNQQFDFIARYEESA